MDPMSHSLASPEQRPRCCLFSTHLLLLSIDFLIGIFPILFRCGLPFRPLVLGRVQLLPTLTPYVVAHALGTGGSVGPCILSYWPCQLADPLHARALPGCLAWA